MDSLSVFLIPAVWFIDIESNHCQICLFGGIQRNNDLIWCANAKRFLGTFHKEGGARGFIGLILKAGQMHGLLFHLNG